MYFLTQLLTVVVCGTMFFWGTTDGTVEVVLGAVWLGTFCFVEVEELGVVVGVSLVLVDV